MFKPSRVNGAAACLGVFGLALFISATAGFSRDEAWFLQVAHRVVNGDVLYRDVFYLTTPLAVQMTAALAQVFGTGILVEKAVASLAFAGEIGWAWLIARELGIARRHAWLVWLAVFVYAQHYPNPPYRAIGSALMLAAFWTLLVWLRLSASEAQAERDRARYWLVATGAASGACFSAMPNHGLLTIASAAVVVAIRTKQTAAPPARWIAPAVLLGPFIVVMAADLAAVIWRGDFLLFLDYSFLNKGPYVRAGGASYWAELVGLLTPDLGALPDTLKRFYRGLHVLLIPVAIVGVLDGWRRAPAGRRLPAFVVLLLVVDAFVGAYPRMNRFHLSYAAPAVVIALAFSAETWSRLLHLRLSTVRLMVGAWLVLGFLSTMVTAAGLTMSADRKWSSLPHFRGVLIARTYEEEISGRAARLVAAAGSDAPLLITLDSGVYYLVTGLRNPTPFDQVHVMNFGTHGEEQVISAIAAGRIHVVCLGPVVGLLGPARIERHVRETMSAREDVGFCTTYR